MSHALILIGGFGFIGRNILDVVIEENKFSSFMPVVIDDLSNSCPGYEVYDLPMHIGSYQDTGAKEFLDNLDSKKRTFVFLAGETRVAESKERPMDFIHANINAPSSFVLENIKPGDHFILISTAGALFDGTFEVSIDSPYCPKNFYGASKAAEEMILEKLVELRGGIFSIVRLTNVFGPHSIMKKSAIHAFTRAIIEGETVTLNGDGQQSRDFIFSRDVGFGVAKLADLVRTGNNVMKVNMLGSGVSTPLIDVIKTIEEETGKELAYHQIPAEDLIATEPRDVIAKKADVLALLEGQITPFSEGIRKTYRYYTSMA